MRKVLLGQKFIAYQATRMMHFIPDLKRDPDSQHFAMEEDLQSAVSEFFVKQDSEWYSAGIHKLILRYNE